MTPLLQMLNRQGCKKFQGKKNLQVFKVQTQIY